MKNSILQLSRYLYIISLIILLILYLFPGSLIGYLLFGNFNKQPVFFPNPLETSINHTFAFFYVTMLGVISCAKKYNFKKRIFFLISLSILTELMHIFIPNRSFQYLDLFANFFGIILAIIIIIIYKNLKTHIIIK